MSRSLVILLFINMVIMGCSSSEKHKADVKEDLQAPFLFNMHTFLNEGEYKLSFPVWFNDSIIAVNQIAKIHRKIYRNIDQGETLKEIRHYFFNQRGEVIEFSIEEYYDDRVVGTLTAKYKDAPDLYGFAKVKITESSGMDVTESNFKTYVREEYTEKYLVFTEEVSHDYLFFLTDDSFWGVLSVDSILKPTTEDIVVYGIPKKPMKQFQIKNKVNESNVKEYQYNENYGFIKTLVFDNYPFREKRYFVYDEQGNFSYFVDSTFSSDSFLNKCVSKIETGSKLLPQQMTHEHYMAGAKMGYVEHEKFEYEFFKK